jgi:hypothetical protein
MPEEVSVCRKCSMGVIIFLTTTLEIFFVVLEVLIISIKTDEENMSPIF